MTSYPTDCSLACELHHYDASLRDDPVPALATPAILDDQEETAARLYRPIKRWQTRILDLKPSQSVEILESKLHVAHLTEGAGLVLKDQDEQVSYHALSYCWGPPVFDRAIRIDDVLHPITRSVHCALHRLRRRLCGNFYIWVDALCINQHDLAERSDQVSIMLQIYKKAKSVLVWQGEHDAASELLFHYAFGEGGGQRVKSLKDKSRTVQLCRTHTASLMEGLNTIISAPWCKVGEHSLSVTHVGADIVSVLRRSVGSGASVASDRIYALLGMTTTCVGRSLPWSRDSNILVLDYGKTATEGTSIAGICKHEPRGSSVTFIKPNYGLRRLRFFQDLTRYLICRDGCLAVLMLSATFGGSIDGMPLPSWEIDWRRTTDTKPYGIIQQRIHQASEDISVERGLRIDDRRVGDTSGNGEKLLLEGYCIGEVQCEVEDKEWQLVDNGSPALNEFKRMLQGEIVEKFRSVQHRVLRGYLHQETRAGIPRTMGNSVKYWVQSGGIVLEDVADDLAASHNGTLVETIRAKISTLPMNTHQNYSTHAGDVVFRKTRNMPLGSAKGDRFPGTKQMKVAMRQREGYPSYTDQPDLEWRHTSHCLAHGHKRCKEERTSKPNDMQPSKVDPDGTVSSFWTVPDKTQPGDVIALAEASSLVLILRPGDGEQGEYEYVGPALINRGLWCEYAPCSTWDKPALRGSPREAKAFVWLKEWLTGNCSRDRREMLRLV